MSEIDHLKLRLSRLEKQIGKVDITQKTDKSWTSIKEFIRRYNKTVGAFPVGSIFIAVVPTNPVILLGYGTWVAFGTGRVLVGINSGDGDFDAAEKTGGAKTHQLTVDEMPVHTHVQDAHRHLIDEVRESDVGTDTTQIARTEDASSTLGSDVYTDYATAVNQNAGGNTAHNNLQPYIVVYMWKRTV